MKLLCPLLLAAALSMFVSVQASEIRMYDQAGGAIGAGVVKYRLTFDIDEPLFRFYWRVSIPYAHNEWGEFVQDIPSGGIDIGFSRPYVLAEDTFYDTHVVRWYRWDDVPASTLQIEFQANFTSTMSFQGRSNWDNDEQEHQGTYWVDNVNCDISGFSTERADLAADAGVRDHLCGTWPFVDLATAYTSSITGSCAYKTFVASSLLRGWIIPTGQLSGILLPGVMEFGGVSATITGADFHSCVAHWCDLDQEWTMIEPAICAMGQSPQMFVQGMELDEHWVNWAWAKVGGSFDPLWSVNFPVSAMESNWSFVELVGGQSRNAPTYTCGLDQAIASQRYNFDPTKTFTWVRSSSDESDCYDFTMVGVPGEGPSGSIVRVIPNPVMKLAEFVTGSETAMVRIYDVRGRRVGEGTGRLVRWNADVPPGMYFVRFTDGQSEEVRKFAVVR